MKLGISPGVRQALLTIAITLAIVYVAFAATVLWAMRQPPETFGKVMAKMPGPVPFLLFPFEAAWTHARAGYLQIGDQAPDFSLNKLDKSGIVKLSQLNASQPVVLVFGSYT
jgi:hypothetical protein